MKWKDKEVKCIYCNSYHIQQKLWGFLCNECVKFFTYEQWELKKW